MMQLTILCIVLAFVSPSVLGLPVSSPRRHHNAAANPSLADPLEQELKSVLSPKEPEVKRSERVELPDEPFQRADFSEAAKADVVKVIKTFFTNLKDKPEIVDEMIARQGSRLMNEVADEESENAPMAHVATEFRHPNPQLALSPKQVEKKMGAFPEYPRFIYKSPMRTANERNELHAVSLNNPLVARNLKTNLIGEDESQHLQADISNSIPVLQQPTTDREADGNQMDMQPFNGIPKSPTKQLDDIQREQDENSQRHPFINPLPLFHENDPDTSANVSPLNPPPAKPAVEPPSNHITNPSQSHSVEEARPVEIASPLEPPSVEAAHAAGPLSESPSESSPSDLDKSMSVADTTMQDKLSLKSKLQKQISEVEGEAHREVESVEPPHYMTGGEIAAESLNHPVESESSVPYPSSYYYMYDDRKHIANYNYNWEDFKEDDDVEADDAGDYESDEDDETDDGYEDAMEEEEPEVDNDEHAVDYDEDEVDSYEHEYDSDVHEVENNEHEVNSDEHEIESDEVDNEGHEADTYKHEADSYEHEVDSDEHEVEHKVENEETNGEDIDEEPNEDKVTEEKMQVARKMPADKNEVDLQALQRNPM